MNFSANDTVLTFPDPLIQSFGLNPLTLEDRHYFQRVLSNLNEPISDYSFAYIFVWVNSWRLYWKTIHKHLCVFVAEDDLLHLFMPPMPEENALEDDMKNALLECFSIMDSHNETQGKPLAGMIQYVSDELLDKIKQCSLDDLVITPYSGDYIYETQKIITLSGSSLASKRHSRNKFMREWPDFRIEAINETHAPACRELLHVWHQNGKAFKDTSKIRDVNDQMRDLEMIACQMAISHWQQLGLQGIVLFAGDKLVGFTFGEALKPNQASIIIEKADPDFYGASTMIFSEFCRQCWTDYPVCNAGDDGNIPALQFTKQEYRPIRFLNKWFITRNQKS